MMAGCTPIRAAVSWKDLRADFCDVARETKHRQTAAI